MSANVPNTIPDLDVVHAAYSAPLRVARPASRGAFLMVKRALDVCGSITGLLLLSPMFFAVAVLLRLEERSAPVFFRQERIGKNGNTFSIVKFRSMIADAEECLRSDPALYRKYIENNYKLEPCEDPRITRLGRFLRRTSLDEMPQLWNVLRGQMSLVGPRPVVQEELNEYRHRVVDFLSVKPGVTGYWQVCGRSRVGYPERVDVELHYVYHQSVLFDLVILFKTVVVVLLKRGAY